MNMPKCVIFIEKNRKIAQRWIGLRRLPSLLTTKKLCKFVFVVLCVAVTL